MKHRTPKMGRPPIHAWINATYVNLEHLRYTIIDHHREVFEQATPLPVDSPGWLAKAVDTNIHALIHTLKLYEQVARMTINTDDIDF